MQCPFILKSLEIVRLFFRRHMSGKIFIKIKQNSLDLSELFFIKITIFFMKDIARNIKALEKNYFIHLLKELKLRIKITKLGTWEFTLEFKNNKSMPDHFSKYKIY
ncbi:hypothetical protein BpHYR1_029654 [Brachionus plicatilis]|uniref:Uncharacterized protein n=1 Tax=Brachionus plicatilis TaxID=10195 RepID=A0A3M7QZL8_BRAPC|nr:hypothetical protein BpHYR1_029654 [Brachionus plicatilis]